MKHKSGYIVRRTCLTKVEPLRFWQLVAWATWECASNWVLDAGPTPLSRDCHVDVVGALRHGSKAPRGGEFER
jgi:hypothetical protein